MRIRPFAFYGVSTCNTTEQDKLAKNGSYPSGHTSIGWATAPCWRRSTRSGKTKF